MISNKNIKTNNVSNVKEVQRKMDKIERTILKREKIMKLQLK